MSKSRQEKQQAVLRHTISLQKQNINLNLNQKQNLNLVFLTSALPKSPQEKLMSQQAPSRQATGGPLTQKHKLNLDNIFAKYGSKEQRQANGKHRKKPPSQIFQTFNNPSRDSNLLLLSP